VLGPYTNAWTIDGTFNTDYIVGRAITGFTFNNGNNTFKVDADGTVSAKKINITGGSIDIETNSQTDDLIRLTKSEWTSKMSPLETVLDNTTTKDELKLQAGGLYLSNDSAEKVIVSQQGIYVKDANNNNAVVIDSTGITTSGSVSASGDVECSDGNGHSYLVAAAIHDLYSRL
jgi:hypothetical protein